jgi:AraC-like DNA-binding protein
MVWFSYIRHWFANQLIRNKIIMIYLPLIIIPLFILGYVSNRIFSNIIIEKTKKNFYDNSSLIISRIDSKLENSENCANTLAVNLNRVFGSDFSPFSEIKNKNSIDEAYNWVVNLFEKILQNSVNNKMTKTRKIAEAAKDYIDLHYPDQNLNINKVASNVYVNSSYLRAIFKKEFGFTINEYIIDVRMKKAREYITTDNLKFSEISELIGFSDASYFSKRFKKHFGVSPSEYEVISK